MGVLAKTVGLNSPTLVRNCPFGKWFDTLDDEDVVVVQKLFVDPMWTTTAILKFFKENGCVAGERGIRRHRKGECLECASR